MILCEERVYLQSRIYTNCITIFLCQWFGEIPALYEQGVSSDIFRHFSTIRRVLCSYIVIV